TSGSMSGPRRTNLVSTRASPAETGWSPSRNTELPIPKRVLPMAAVRKNCLRDVGPGMTRPPRRGEQRKENWVSLSHYDASGAPRQGGPTNHSDSGRHLEVGFRSHVTVMRQNHPSAGRNARILKLLLDVWYAEPSARDVWSSPTALTAYSVWPLIL